MIAPLNILIACGGTGGHLFPGIAVAQELRARGHKPTLLISTKEVDHEASEKYSDLDFLTIPAIAKPPMLSLKAPGFLLKLGSSYAQCRSIIQSRSIHLVLGMGGFTSLAPIIAGSHAKCPCFIHDSNALPGKANRFTARWCQSVLLGIEDARAFFPDQHCELTGTPTREEFATQARPDVVAARRALDLPTQGRLILVLGGSQGALRLNEIILEAAEKDKESTYLIIAGSANEHALRAQAQGMSHVYIRGFCAQMAEAYAACDGVITRAGASTLTELSLLGKAALLVPYPHAADDHQSYNARAFSSRGAAQLCQESDLTARTVVDFCQGVIGDPTKRLAMEQAMRSLSAPDAAARIADILCYATSPR